MAKKQQDDKTFLRETGEGIGEALASEALRSGGASLVHLFESYLRRMDPRALKMLRWGVTIASGAIQTPIQRRLSPLIGEVKANVLAEAAQEFFAGTGAEVAKMVNPTDADVQRVANEQAVRAGAWYSVRAELVDNMKTSRPRNFNANAMSGLGTVAEQMAVMHVVNEGIAMLAAADRAAYMLLTGADFSTTENIRNFELAVRQARTARAAGRDPIPYLRGSLAVNTQDDSAMPFVVDGILRDASEYFGAKIDGVMGFLREQFSAPEEPDETPEFRWGEVHPRSWWHLKNTNLRGFLTWLGFTSGSLFTIWIILRSLTVAVWFGFTGFSVAVGGTAGLVLALMAMFAQFVGFCASLTFVGGAVGLVQLVAAVPVIVKRELYGLIGRDTSDITIPKFQHALDVRWRTEMACMGLGFLYLLFSVVLGANVLSAILSFLVLSGAVVLTLTLHFLDDSFGDNYAWKQGAIRGSAKLILWLVVIGVLVALPSWAFFRLNSEAMGDYLAGVGAMNLGRLLHQSLPVAALGLVFLGAMVAAAYLAVIRRDFRNAFKAGLVMVALALAIALAQAFLPASSEPLLVAPATSRPTHNAPSGMSSAPPVYGARSVYDGHVAPSGVYVPADPWSDAGEIIGDF